MSMHAARLACSPRLQRVHDLLADRREHSTMDIVQACSVCAVNSIVAELRAGGAEIACRQIRSHRGERVWLYSMTRPVLELS